MAADRSPLLNALESAENSEDIGSELVDVPLDPEADPDEDFFGDRLCNVAKALCAAFKSREESALARDSKAFFNWEALDVEPAPATLSA